MRTLVEEFRFLRPWTLVLPDAFPCVLAVAGCGAKSTLLERLAGEYEKLGRRVIVTRTAPGPPPAGGEGLTVLPQCDPDECFADLARRHGADVVLVEAQDSCGSLLWPDAPAPRWPSDCDLVLGVMNLQALGRLWSPGLVHLGFDGGEERRVQVSDLLECFTRMGVREGRLPNGLAWIPFLSGLGALRDVDAMFDLGQRLWEDFGARLVCFGELIGDPRRDAADRAGIEGSAASGDFLTEDRVYAIYPARLDEDVPTSTP
jgi:hypothetical protein